MFTVSFGYLCITHIYRQVYDYGGYTLDITGLVYATCPLYWSLTNFQEYKIVRTISDRRVRSSTPLAILVPEIQNREHQWLQNWLCAGPRISHCDGCHKKKKKKYCAHKYHISFLFHTIFCTQFGSNCHIL